VPGWAALVALPLALLLIDPNWIYPRPDTVDPWIYVSYFLEPRFQLLAHPLAYHGTRLPIILPGAEVFRHFHPDVALVVLHLLLYYVSVFSLYGTLRGLLGRRAALLGAVLLGGNAMFLSAVGLTHADGFGVTYALLTIFLVSRATLGRFWLVPLFAAGGASALFLFTNIAYLPHLILFPWLLVTLPRDRGRKRLPGGLFSVALGFAAVTGGLALASQRLCGRPLFFWPWVRAMLFMLPCAEACAAPGRGWFFHAGWLALPALALAAAAAAWRAGLFKGAGAAAARALVGAFGLVVCVTVLFEGIDFLHYLQFSFYASLLLPPLFLAIGALLSLVAGGWPEGTYRLAVAAAFAGGACALLPINGGGIGFANVWLLPLAVGAAGLAALARPRLVAGHLPAVAVGLFGLMNVLCASNFERLLAACPLERKHVPAQEWVGVWADPMPGRAYRDPQPTRRQAFRLVADAFRLMAFHDTYRGLRLWYPLDDGYASLYTAVSSTYLWDQRMLSPHFPRLDDLFGSPIDLHGTFDGLLGALGYFRVAVVCREGRPALEEARAALAGVGLRPEAVCTQSLARWGAPVRVLILDLKKAVPPDSQARKE
jgi:hypothetical protein